MGFGREVPKAGRWRAQVAGWGNLRGEPRVGGPEFEVIRERWMRLKLCLLLGSAAVVVATMAHAQDYYSEQTREHSLTERLNRQQLAIHAMPRYSLRRRWVWNWDEGRWVQRSSGYRNVTYGGGYRNVDYGYARVVPTARPAPDMSADRSPGAAEHAPKHETVAALESPKAARVEPTEKSAPKPASGPDFKNAAADSTAPKDTTADKAPPKSMLSDSKPLTPAEIRAAVPLEKVSDAKQALASAEIRSLWGDNIGKVHGVDLDNGAVKTVDADLSGQKRVVKLDASRLKYVKSRNVVLTSMSKADVDKLPKADNS